MGKLRSKEAREHKKKMDDAFSDVKTQGGLLKNMAKSSWRGTRILIHNGLICGVYWAIMLIVCYAAMRAAMYVTAFLIGASGVTYLSEDTGLVEIADVSGVLTAYTVMIMVCGFCLFAGVGICRALWRAAKRRLWRTDRATGGIDRGTLWHEKHDVLDDDSDGEKNTASGTKLK